MTPREDLNELLSDAHIGGREFNADKFDSLWEKVEEMADDYAKVLADNERMKVEIEKIMELDYWAVRGTAAEKERDQLRAKLEIAREALEWYVENGYWNQGELAKEALEKLK